MDTIAEPLSRVGGPWPSERTPDDTQRLLPKLSVSGEFRLDDDLGKNLLGCLCSCSGLF